MNRWSHFTRHCKCNEPANVYTNPCTNVTIIKCARPAFKIDDKEPLGRFKLKPNPAKPCDFLEKFNTLEISNPRVFKIPLKIEDLKTDKLARPPNFSVHPYVLRARKHLTPALESKLYFIAKINLRIEPFKHDKETFEEFLCRIEAEKPWINKEHEYYADIKKKELQAIATRNEEKRQRDILNPNPINIFPWLVERQKQRLTLPPTKKILKRKKKKHFIRDNSDCEEEEKVQSSENEQSDFEESRDSDHTEQSVYGSDDEEIEDFDEGDFGDYIPDFSDD